MENPDVIIYGLDSNTRMMSGFRAVITDKLLRKKGKNIVLMALRKNCL